MRELLRRVLPPRAVASVRRLNRLRWVTKYRNLRGAGRPLLANRMLGLRHVLFDPELESYTYELANEAELAQQLASIFEVRPEQVAGYFRETREDPELNETLRRRVRWNFATKRSLPLGNRAIWYVVVRIRKPRIVVETGILSGLGSLGLLRAIERNASEGHPGHLISVDSDPTAGWLVPEHLRGDWTKLVGTATDVLPTALGDDAVGVFIQDSPHSYENQRGEFAIAVQRADDPLVLLDCGGGQTDALAEICTAWGARRHAVRPRPVRHIYPPTSTDVAVIKVARDRAFLPERV